MATRLQRAAVGLGAGLGLALAFIFGGGGAAFDGGSTAGAAFAQTFDGAGAGGVSGGEIAGGGEIADDEVGIAAVVGDAASGGENPTGAPYDRDAMTAVHHALPVGSSIRVENLDNGASVALRVIDRRAFADGRILEASPAAARALGYVDVGLARVRVTVTEEAVDDAPSAAPPTTEVATTLARGLSLSPATATTQGAGGAAGGGTSAVREEDAGAEEGAGGAGWYVQIAAFFDQAAAQSRVGRGDLPDDVRVFAGESRGRAVWRLRIGPFASRDAATKRLAAVRARGFPSAFTQREIN